MTGPLQDAQRSQVEQGIRTLVEWAVAMKLEDIPRPVLRKATLIIADDLAAIVAARKEPEVERVHSQFLASGGRQEATIFRGGRPRTDRISAALANGIAGSWCELDEGYRLSSCHAGLYTLPALFADAEILGLSVAQMLRAAVLSYEITTRFARCWTFPQMTLHPHAQTAAIGGTAASGIARGLTAKQLLDAVTASATLVTVGDYRHAVEGALVRNVWAAVGCSNGMRAVDWALCGIGGMPGGPCTTFTNLLKQPPTPEHLTRNLGTEWAITNNFHKIHACCQSTHSAVEATLMALERMPAGKGPHDVERIVLETYRPEMSNLQPSTSLAAKFSFEHALATTQVHGHAGSEAFAAQTLADPLVARLRERVEIRIFEPLEPPPNDRPARVTLHLNDGRTVATECLSARGGPDRPFTEDMIIEKVDRLTRKVYPQLMPIMRSIMLLDEERMNTQWDAIVAEITAG